MVEVPRSADTHLHRWLSARGLRADPFACLNAEHEADLPYYFVDVERFDELLEATEPCVVFAARGCGKTAQRRMLAAQCRPERTDGPRLAAHYTYDGFQQALTSAGDDPTRVRTDHHVAAILGQALGALRKARQSDPHLDSLLQRPDLAFRLQALAAPLPPQPASLPVPTMPSSSDGPSPSEQLDALVQLLADCGLGPLVILVDGLDEFPTTAGDPARITDFLAPLLGTLPLIERPGLAFKFFLPQEVEAELRRRPWFRTDRLRLFHVVWDDRKLQEMLGQRLVHFSVAGNRPYTRLGQLCQSELAGRIDAELVSLAGGLPRAALALADLLLRTHCRAAEPTDQIGLATWEEVREAWKTRRADFLGTDRPQEPATPTPAPVAVWPALFVDEKTRRVWVGETEITAQITALELRVLLCLYRHADRICDKDLLIQEAWPDAQDGEGVSDQAIAATISRLRKQLGQPTPERGYIETIRGRGHRLHPQGFGPAG
ncbi:MAG: winged helix-turn-helix domain-containing protein [Anaerolineae bacterium]